MKYSRFVWSGAFVLAAAVLVGCSGDTKKMSTAPVGPPRELKDAPKDFHPASGVTSGTPDKEKMMSSLQPGKHPQGGRR